MSIRGLLRYVKTLLTLLHFSHIMKRMTDAAYTRLDEPMKDALAALGQEHDRKLSYMIRLAIAEFLDLRGSLPPLDNPPKPIDALVADFKKNRKSQ